MTLSRRHFVHGTSACLLLGSLPHALAQVLDATKVVIGFAPGGTIDVTGRRIAEKLAPTFAKSTIVENRTGAGGQFAVNAVRTAAPDGSMILLTPASPLGLHPFTYRQLSYDPVNDLLPVSGAAVFDYALAIGPQVPATVTTVREFLAWAKANPGNATFGSAGVGSAANFIGSALGKTGNLELRHIPFRGSQPAILEMISGRLAAVVGPTGEFMSQVKAGKARLIATSGPTRGKFTADVASYAEQGFKDLAYLGWFGFYVPAKTPRDVVQRLNDAIRAALLATDLVEGLATMYLEPFPTTSQQLAALLNTETEFWRGLVNTVGFTPGG